MCNLYFLVIFFFCLLLFNFHGTINKHCCWIWVAFIFIHFFSVFNFGGERKQKKTALFSVSEQIRRVLRAVLRSGMCLSRFKVSPGAVSHACCAPALFLAAFSVFYTPVLTLPSAGLIVIGCPVETHFVISKLVELVNLLWTLQHCLVFSLWALLRLLGMFSFTSLTPCVLWWFPLFRVPCVLPSQLFQSR